jgi:hypothetical protein
MYTVNLKGATEIKVAKGKLSDEAVMEVMYAYTSLIRIFMGFRAGVTFWAAYFLPESDAKDYLCYGLTAVDCYILSMLLRKLFFPKEMKVLVHDSSWLPTGIQSLFVIAGILLFLTKIKVLLIDEL